LFRVIRVADAAAGRALLPGWTVRRGSDVLVDERSGRDARRIVESALKTTFLRKTAS
jgi:hypothetical protein